MKFKKRKVSIKIISLIIFIFVMAIINVFLIGNMMTSKVIGISFDIIERNFYTSIHQDFKGQVITNEELNKMVELKLNDKSEIMYMDYNYEYVNNYLKEQIDELFMKLEKTDFNGKYFDSQLGVLRMPLGIVTNNVLFSNLGPKIPCKLNVLNNIDMSIKTKIKEYGINNSLIEIYLLINIKSSIINPVIEDKFVKNYEVLIDSKVIEGKIPSYYGGVLEKSSTIVSS